MKDVDRFLATYAQAVSLLERERRLDPIFMARLVAAILDEHRAQAETIVARLIRPQDPAVIAAALRSKVTTP